MSHAYDSSKIDLDPWVAGRSKWLINRFLYQEFETFGQSYIMSLV